MLNLSGADYEIKIETHSKLDMPNAALKCIQATPIRPSKLTDKI